MNNKELIKKLSSDYKKLERLTAERTKKLQESNEQLYSEIQKNREASKHIEALSIFPEMNPAPVLKLNTSGEIVLCNSAALELFKQQSLTGKKWSDVCPDFSNSECFLDSETTSEICQHESQIEGKELLFTYKRVPERDYIFIFGADISKRRKAEKMLQEAHDNLENNIAIRTSELTEAKKELQKALSQVEDLKNQFQAENIYLQEEIRLNHNFEEIIGQSSAIKSVLAKVELVAATDATVLILGETGTGKELFARAIHSLSPRNKRPLVKVNCSALQPTLIESELFGHEKGAFTGAFMSRTGRFELANNGAIFLDEIGELTMELQVKLLRVLQEKEIERLGGSETIKVDVRIIAATNKNLEKAVADGTFREDLYYRLNVFPITLPPLRDRREDIPVLVQYFINKYSLKTQKEITSIPEKVMEALKSLPWPGNIREMENIIERAVILSTEKTLHLERSLAIAPQENSREKSEEWHLSLDELQRRHIIKTLHKTNWRVEGKKGAAALLDINASTLRSRMLKFQISRP